MAVGVFGVTLGTVNTWGARRKIRGATDLGLVIGEPPLRDTVHSPAEMMVSAAFHVRA